MRDQIAGDVVQAPQALARRLLIGGLMRSLRILYFIMALCPSVAASDEVKDIRLGCSGTLEEPDKDLHHDLRKEKRVSGTVEISGGAYITVMMDQFGMITGKVDILKTNTLRFVVTASTFKIANSSPILGVIDRVTSDVMIQLGTQPLSDEGDYVFWLSSALYSNRSSSTSI